MINFEFYTPTKIYFGKDTQNKVGEIIKNYGFKKILLHYGGGSIKKTGLYDQVIKSLKENEIEFIELGGVEANPKVSLVRVGVELCKKENVELILAVGGGSVIDSAKVMAIAALSDKDPWDYSSKKAAPTKGLPVGTILTLSASGSEMSDSAVLTNEEGELKRGYNTEFNRPMFSILNPELTYTVDKFQTGCGIVDIMMHTLERYFTRTKDVDLTDHLAEGLLKSVINAGAVAIVNPEDYEARATLMWAGSLSHNNLTGAGRDVFMECHQIEHELSGAYDFVAHGAGLSIIFPAWAKYVYKHNVEKFCQYAVRVWNIEMNFENPEETALNGILATENYFKSLDMPVRLSELNIGDERLEEMAEKCTFLGTRVLPSYIPLDKKEIIDIFNLCK